MSKEELKKEALLEQLREMFSGEKESFIQFVLNEFKTEVFSCSTYHALGKTNKKKIIEEHPFGITFGKDELNFSPTPTNRAIMDRIYEEIGLTGERAVAFFGGYLLERGDMNSYDMLDFMLRQHLDRLNKKVATP